MARLEKAEETKKVAVEALLDESSCLPLPVTAEYLWTRVPGMTVEAARIIVGVLLEHNHLDPSTSKLIVDPTRSDWRDFFLKNSDSISIDNNNNNNRLPTPPSLLPTNESKNNKMILWGTFDLTRTMSPLAKALHRAWAMHEYCSESVPLALDYFEGKQSKEELIQRIRQQQQQQQHFDGADYFEGKQSKEELIQRIRQQQQQQQHFDGAENKVSTED
eukprot:CAMPEP_0201253584 /NCGR_PEP_ID=MMETSP0852-20130820/67524_1 /ASSEMBLY_ACC=CAM_ASM_000632 /TAXON_ID=183588 /ORGANISM="Pseudo-nitzschia fraudulenta, Strain WWA7" /LENGTH=217 /DNA_ID=CAMNT_0047553371 /DNA_START=70 /DNA_END=723 /DNA_ORIENTATION=+